MSERGHDIFRHGFVHVLSEKCSTCIFRPGNKMSLEPGRVKSMVDGSVKEGGAIPCHQTLAYGTYEVPGEAVCRGFWDAHRDRVQGLQVAERLGLVHVQDPPTKGIEWP